jgi:hypothetical protein
VRNQCEQVAADWATSGKQPAIEEQRGRKSGSHGISIEKGGVESVEIRWEGHVNS